MFEREFEGAIVEGEVKSYIGKDLKTKYEH